MNPQQKEALLQAISLLNFVAGQSTAHTPQKSPKKAVIPQFDSQFAGWLNLSKQLSPQIQRLSSIYEEAIDMMRSIIGYSAFCPKFNSKEEEVLKSKFTRLIPEVDKLQKNEYIDHSRAIKQLLSSAFWVFVNAPQIMLKSAIESSDFYASKFLKKKVVQHNEWYKKLGQAVRTLQQYVLQNYPGGLNFNTKGTHNWGALLDQKAVSEQKVVQKEVKAVQKPSQVQKKSKKAMVGLNLCLSNFNGEKFQLGEKDFQMKHGILLQNCNNMQISLTQKCKSIQINKCGRIFINLKSCVSGIQIVNSKDITIMVKESIPSFSADNSQTVKLILSINNLNCEILTTKVEQMSVSYEDANGNEAKDFHVSEQMITKWNNTKKCFETTIFKQQFD